MKKQKMLMIINQNQYQYALFCVFCVFFIFVQFCCTFYICVDEGGYVVYLRFAFVYIRIKIIAHLINVCWTHISVKALLTWWYHLFLDHLNNVCWTHISVKALLTWCYYLSCKDMRLVMCARGLFVGLISVSKHFSCKDIHLCNDLLLFIEFEI